MNISFRKLLRVSESHGAIGFLLEIKKGKE